MRAVAITPLYYSYAFATLGIALDRRFLFGVGALAAAAAVAALWPSAAYDIVGVGGGDAIALTVWAWRDRDSDQRASRYPA